MPPQQLFRVFPWVTRLVTLWTMLAFLATGCPLWAVDLVISGETLKAEAFGTIESFNQITGSGTLLETGEGEIRLTGAGLSSFTGGIVINGGALVVSGSGQLGGASNTVDVNGTTTAGFHGGMLVVEGGTAGLTLQQNMNLSGYGPIR